MQLRSANAAVEVNCRWYKDHHPNQLLQLHSSFSAALSKKHMKRHNWRNVNFSAVKSFKMQGWQMHMMGRSWGRPSLGIWMPIKWPNHWQIWSLNFFQLLGGVTGWVWIMIQTQIKICIYSTFLKSRIKTVAYLTNFEFLLFVTVLMS